MVRDLVERLHPPLSKRLAVGVEVVTPRGYGIVAGYAGDGLADFGSATYFGPPRRSTTFVLVEIEDGLHVPFRPEQLQVVERVGA
jgi:hypothetical protein